MMNSHWGEFANWPAPPNIHALTTTREVGHSQPPYDHNNFGLHVGDNEAHVRLNRLALLNALLLPNEPAWLLQTHTNHCVVIEKDSNRLADAAVTRRQEFPLAIMTADCLPIMLCNREGTEIAAIHAGWRGLVNGIVENTLLKMESKAETLLAWIGPAICQRCYQVGNEVLETFATSYPFTASSFKKQGAHHYANLPKMAELILNSLGVTAVYHAAACTFEHKNKFYSYRREAQTGRMATLIWFSATN